MCLNLVARRALRGGLREGAVLVVIRETSGTSDVEHSVHDSS
jgi:hypothetical protein